MKILMVAAGRRNQFASYLHQNNINFDCYESDKNCPIALLADKVILGKKWNDPDISLELSNLSKHYDLVIPFHDHATDLLSKLNLSNCCVSSYQTCLICLDKKEFEKFFINDPDLVHFYPKEDLTEVVEKPRKGVSSYGIKFYPLNSPPDKKKNMIYQKRIYGTEYTVDCFFNKKSNLVDFTPRKRIKIVDGEVVESQTVSKDKFTSIIKLISTKLKFKGPICMQFIEDSNGKLWIIEINARMGGGCTLSIAAGLDLPQLIISEFINNDFSLENYQSNWKKNYYLKRYNMDYCYEKVCI